MAIIPSAAPATTFLDIVNSAAVQALTALQVSVNPNTNKEIVPAIHFDITPGTGNVYPTVTLNLLISAGMIGTYRSPWRMFNATSGLLRAFDPVAVNVVGGATLFPGEFFFDTPGAYYAICEFRTFGAGSGQTVTPQVKCSAVPGSLVRIDPLSDVWHDG